MPLPTIHPGKALLEEMLERNLNLNGLAALVGLEAAWLRDFLLECEDVTPEVAAALGSLGSGPKFWLNLQANHDAAEAPENEVTTSHQSVGVAIASTPLSHTPRAG